MMQTEKMQAKKMLREKEKKQIQKEKKMGTH